MRKFGPLAAYAEVPEEHARFANFTPVVAKQLHALHAQWNWSSVGPKTMRIGLGFICIIVGLQKLITLFFVWFISVVASTPPGATVAIYVATGTVRRNCARSTAYAMLTLHVQGLLFFIPWMAGVPVYLAGGVVITAAFKQLYGFWPALGIAVAVTSATKAIAVFALHRFLGTVRVALLTAAVCLRLTYGAAPQVWMKDAGLRRDFELTSVKMRAMEMILSRPGADIAKACSVFRTYSYAALTHAYPAALQLCMLVAGPDWLTSVLAGMHNTDVWRILGSQMAPTTLLIAGPATMAGAFQLRVSEGGSWLATSSLLQFFAAACQASVAALLRHATARNV